MKSLWGRSAWVSRFTGEIVREFSILALEVCQRGLSFFGLVCLKQDPQGTFAAVA